MSLIEKYQEYAGYKPNNSFIFNIPDTLTPYTNCILVISHDEDDAIVCLDAIMFTDLMRSNTAGRLATKTSYLLLGDEHDDTIDVIGISNTHGTEELISMLEKYG